MLSPMSSIKSLTRFALPLALAVGLSACTTPFKADVSRFAAPLPAPQGQSFAVVPEDPKLAMLVGATFVVFLIIAFFQVRRLRRSQPATTLTTGYR